MRLCAAWIVIAAVASADEARPVQVIADPGFEARPIEGYEGGWHNQAAGGEGVTSEWLKEGGRGGSPCVHVASSAGPDGLWIWRQHVADPPTLRRCRLSAWVKAADVQGNVIVCIRCSAENGDLVGFGTTQGTCDTAGTCDWKEITCELVPPKGTARLEVLCFLAGTGECWFDDVTLAAYEKAEAAAVPGEPGKDAPGVLRLRGMYRVEAGEAMKEPVALFPLPLSWGPQVPLSWEVHATPAGRVRTWHVFERKPHDWVAQVKLAPIAEGESFSLEWEAFVVCGPSEGPKLPEGVAVERLSEAPEEARTWLASTRCVESDDARFRAIGEEVRKDAKDVADLVARAQAKAADVFQHVEGQATDLRATTALDHPGSCTSNANLVAAVYRACGVPARVLSGYPVWSGPLQTHYIVEVWLPETGWYPIESTMLRHPWPQSQQAAVSLVYPEDEDASAGRACGADGVPYLSLTEAPGGDGVFVMIGTIPGHDDCDHEASLLSALPADDAAWQETLGLAREAWSAWLAAAAKRPAPAAEQASRRALKDCKTLADLSVALRKAIRRK